MRVKLLLALAIASVLLICSISLVAAVAGADTPTAADLTDSALQQCNACGFPDLTSIVPTDATTIPSDSLEALTPVDGCDCGVIPSCACNEFINEIAGPEVNLGCPVVNTFAIPVELDVPAVEAEFSPIDVAPQVCLGLPQVTLNGVCNDILCPTVTNINECPVCTDEVE